MPNQIISKQKQKRYITLQDNDFCNKKRSLEVEFILHTLVQNKHYDVELNRYMQKNSLA